MSAKSKSPRTCCASPRIQSIAVNLLLVLPLLVTGQTAVQVRVTTVDERVYKGTVNEWNRDQLTLGDKNSAETLSSGDLLRVDILNNGAATLPIPAVEVVLVDGSRVAATDFESTERIATIHGNLAESARKARLEPLLNAVHTVRLMEVPASSPEIANEWRELMAMNPAGDMIVVRKKGAKSLNFVEGTIGNVTSDTVEFILDGQTIDVNRDKVFGLIYYRDISAAGQHGTAAIVSGPGIYLPALEVSPELASVRVSTAHLGEVRLPLAAGQSIDYSVGRLQYLSDLRPLRFEWMAAPGEDIVSPVFSQLARDRSFFAPQLELDYPADSLPPEEVGSSGLVRRIPFAKGLALRSRTEVAYRVPRGFPLFRATVGIDPRSSATGAVQLVILGDGQPIWNRTIVGTAPPTEIQCNVDRIRDLAIVVDFSSEAGFTSRSGSTLHVGGARFTK